MVAPAGAGGDGGPGGGCGDRGGPGARGGGRDTPQVGTSASENLMGQILIVIYSQNWRGISAHRRGSIQREALPSRKRDKFIHVQKLV